MKKIFNFVGGFGMSAVLVIDDARIMRVVLKDVLQKYCGYERGNIFEASGGKEGVEQYKEIKPEVVLCDIKMPDMNGIEVVKRIIEFDPKAKIIMVTSSTDEADVRGCITAGAKDYIVKPPSVERVVSAIRDIVGLGDCEYTLESMKEDDKNLAKEIQDLEIVSDDAEKIALRAENAKLKKEIEELKKQLADKG